METQTTKQEELYQKVLPPVDPISNNVEPKAAPDETPSETELREGTKGLHNGQAGGAAGMCAEEIKRWLRGMEREDKEESGNAGAEDTWRIFVKLINAIWENGSIP